MNKPKISSRGVLLFFAGALLASLVIQSAHADMNSYKEIFKNDRVRAYELVFNPGDKRAIRRPAHDYLIYVLEGDEFTLLHPYTSSGINKAKAGKVLWFPADKAYELDSSEEAKADLDNLTVKVNEEHLRPSWRNDHYQKAENVGSTVIRMLVIEFKEVVGKES